MVCLLNLDSGRDLSLYWQVYLGWDLMVETVFFLLLEKKQKTDK